MLLDVFMLDNTQVEEWLANEERSLDKIPFGMDQDMFDSVSIKLAP